MQRRHFLGALAAVPGALSAAASQAARGGVPDAELENPYADVDWDRCAFVPSMSHQHQGQTDASRDVFYEMGYRHFAFSNYYPSSPTPLPDDYRARHPDVATAPNAEQHSFTDAGLHFNGLGSLLATGYGKSLGARDYAATPLVHRFEKLNVFSAARPAEGVYRLDVYLKNVAGDGKTPGPALLTVEGATECAHRERFADRGPIENRPFTAGKHAIYLRTSAPTLATKLVYDPKQIAVTGFRLMQGTNRPWREMFRAALDGETIDGRQVGGLLYQDGGGITLNHPGAAADEYLPMLDFDPRVLGIEVWNQHFGFGAGSERAGDVNLHYYRLWDDLLRAGRRCWGFFVKDHLTYGRGRNVLLLPPASSASAAEHDAAALRAYRRGAFFGAVSSIAVNDDGEAAPPHDRSAFRFRRIAVRRDEAGRAAAIEVAVAGHDAALRPNVQIRFVTDQGTAAVVDAERGEFVLPRHDDGRLIPQFVRIEAFAYPRTHQRGVALTAAEVGKMSVHEISQLHDHRTKLGPANYGGTDDPAPPIPIADLIFSQPLRRV
ncbi:MAG: hypothetical protein JNL96_07440 [Planctomycetaceae bacterium]|nr:hypothetical protein [Planctomycetaceae bacterium]